MATVKCLIVDDDQLKVDRIRELVVSEIGAVDVAVEVVSSANEAVAALRSNRFDLMVVDVNLPLRHGEQPISDGGIRLLKQVGRGTGELQCPPFVIGITSFENLIEPSSAEFAGRGWTLARYSADSISWEETIVNQCKHISDYKGQTALIPTRHDVDVCIFTALFDVELEAILNLPWNFRSYTKQGDEARYSKGEIEVNGRRLTVIACAAPEMGNSASAATTAKVIASFRPRMCIMAGICAGIDAQVGDLVAAEFALNYESGKYKEGPGGEAVFLPQPRYQPASNRLLDAVRRFKVEKRAELLAIPANWSGNRPSKAPELHIGPVASGAAVIENRGIVEGLQFRDRKIVGLEMESYGFYVAGRHALLPKTEYLMLKGVCDNARPPKTDDFQRYAAFLSAQCACELVRAEATLNGSVFG